MIPAISSMIAGKSERDVKEAFLLMTTPHKAIAYNTHLLRCRFAILVPLIIGLAGFSPAMAQKLGDFSTGIYAYQQKDYVTAYRLFEPLAKQGHSAAQYNLGRMYARGEGIPQNYIEAYKWFFLANKNGRKEGAQAMRALAKKLTDLQMKTAILRAGEECCALKR